MVFSCYFRAHIIGEHETVHQSSLLPVKLVVEQGDVGHDRQLVRVLHVHDIRGVEKPGDAQEFLGDVEGEVTVVGRVGGGEEREGEEGRPELDNEAAERPPVPPAGRHVPDVEVRVVAEHSPAPGEQTRRSSQCWRHHNTDLIRLLSPPASTASQLRTLTCSLACTTDHDLQTN